MLNLSIAPNLLMELLTGLYPDYSVTFLQIYIEKKPKPIDTALNFCHNLARSPVVVTAVRVNLERRLSG